MESSRVQLVNEHKINFAESISEFTTLTEKRMKIEELIGHYFSNSKLTENPDIPILIMGENHSPEIVPISPKSNEKSRRIGYSNESKYEKSGNIHEARIHIHESFIPQSQEDFLDLLKFCFSQHLVVSYGTYCEVNIEIFSGEFKQEVEFTQSLRAKSRAFKPKTTSYIVPYFSAILHPRSVAGMSHKLDNQSSTIRFDYFSDNIHTNQISVDSGLQIIFQHVENEFNENNILLSNFLDIVCNLIHSIWLPDVTNQNRSGECMLYLISKMLDNISMDKSKRYSQSIDTIPRNFLFCSLANKNLNSPIQPKDLFSFFAKYSQSSNPKLEQFSSILEENTRDRVDGWRQPFGRLFEIIFESLLELLLAHEQNEIDEQIIEAIKTYYNSQSCDWKKSHSIWELTRSLNENHWKHLKEIFSNYEHEIYSFFAKINSLETDFSAFTNHVIKGPADLTNLFEFYVNCETEHYDSEYSQGVLREYQYGVHSLVHGNPPVFLSIKSKSADKYKSTWKEMWGKGYGPKNLSWLYYTNSRYTLIRRIIAFMELSPGHKSLMERLFCIEERRQQHE